MNSKPDSFASKRKPSLGYIMKAKLSKPKLFFMHQQFQLFRPGAAARISFRLFLSQHHIFCSSCFSCPQIEMDRKILHPSNTNKGCQTLSTVIAHLYAQKKRRLAIKNSKTRKVDVFRKFEVVSQSVKIISALYRGCCFQEEHRCNFFFSRKAEFSLFCRSIGQLGFS